MNEEEKKAIDELSKKAVICNYEERDYPSMICFKKDMLIALNLIEKLQKEKEELKNRCRNLDKEAQGYFEGLAGDDTLSTRTIKQLQEENKTLKELLEGRK